MKEQQIVTITFFRFEGFSNRWWGFKQMGEAPLQLNEVPGLSFFKMLGSGGGNGFSIWPNWGVYALLAVWDTPTHHSSFFEKHTLFQQFLDRSEEWWTIYMKTFKTHGQWDGQSPFAINEEGRKEALVGVLTRATIYPKHLWKFWRFVPPVSKSMDDIKGLLFSVGIGELPLIQQATFSLWQSTRDMQEYAYKSSFHKEVVRKTREMGWYKEELFARFHPFHSEGTWKEALPLEYLRKSP